MMINEDYDVLVKNADRGTYLGAHNPKISHNNVTEKQRKQVEDIVRNNKPQA